MKTCSSCKEEKPFEEFYKRHNGYKSACRLCIDTKNKEKYWANPDKARERALKDYQKQKDWPIEKHLYLKARDRARTEGWEFTITLEDVVVPEKCPYLSVSFIPHDRNWGQSLDRIDSAKGYIKGNVQVISRLANRMKSNATEQELITFAKGVLEVHQGGAGRC